MGWKQFSNVISSHYPWNGHIFCGIWLLIHALHIVRFRINRARFTPGWIPPTSPPYNGNSYTRKDDNYNETALKINLVITGCYIDNLRSPQWQQSWHYDSFRFSMCPSLLSSTPIPILYTRPRGCVRVLVWMPPWFSGPFSWERQYPGTMSCQPGADSHRPQQPESPALWL